MSVTPVVLPSYTISVSEKHGHDSLHANEQTGEKECLVTIDTMTIARPDITTGIT
jgi:hypothetical protein